MELHLPELADIKKKLDQHEELTPLEAFIWDQTPAAKWEWAFRESLHAAIRDALKRLRAHEANETNEVHTRVR